MASSGKEFEDLRLAVFNAAKEGKLKRLKVKSNSGSCILSYI